ncbi:MAG: LysR family transcriptional regulator [Myxococcota bacterium]|nr:LysR family transcriptional regulator [Myxococcota bacterium]
MLERTSVLHKQQRSPSLEDLEAFVRVAETGSFTEAARRMRLPKSTISRRISRLEAELDAALVTRTSRRVTLTEAGAIYLERISPALARIEEASHAAREERERPRGHVRITTPFDVAVTWLAPLAVELRKTYPEVTLEVLVDDRRLDLLAEGIDLAVRAAPQLQDSSLVARKLASVDLSLWAAPKYLRARGTPKALEDLARHDIVALRGTQARARLVVSDPEGAERTIEVTAPIASNDFAFVRQIAIAGGGIAVLPALLASEKTSAGPLRHVLPGWSAGTSSLFVVYPSARLVPAKVRAVRDFLVARAPSLAKLARCPQ